MTRLERIGDLEVLIVAGSPEEMGLAHGEILRERIRRCIDDFLGVGCDQFGIPYEYFVEQSLLLEQFIPPRLVREMRGISEGSGIEYREVLVLNCFVDIDAIYQQRIFQCHNFIAAPPLTKDGIFIHGRNTDFPAPDVIGKNSIVVARIPEDSAHLRTLSVMWPGFVGVITGANGEKLTVGEVGAVSKDCSASGMPMPIMIRAALEETRTCHDFARFIKDSPRTAAFNIAVADGKTREGLAVEFTHSMCESRTAVRDILVVDDVCFCKHTRRKRLYAAHAVFRYSRMIQLLNDNRGLIDLDSAFRFLGDRYDASDASTNCTTSNSICNCLTLQSVLFLPAEERLFVALGQGYAAECAYTEIRLSEIWDNIEGNPSGSLKHFG